jgi:hypothetical protein
VAALAAGVLACGWGAPAQAKPPTVTIAFVPRTTLVQRLADSGFSPGLLSAGIGDVTAERTYRDISAGNREPPPSDAVPGLLRSTLSLAGLSSSLRQVQASPDDLAALVAGLHGRDLLIALGKPPPPNNRALPVGIAGSGFDGNLTSDSTRTGGYVLSTDLAPTILRRLGVSIPAEMNGQPIRAEGQVDAAAVIERGDRMTAVAERRIGVLTGCLVLWIVLTGGVALAAPSWRRRAGAWLALAFAYMPLLLLAGAALKPADAVYEGLLVAVGAGGLAAVTLAVFGGWRALAVACALTVGAYALDMVTGSELTKLSLLGPNPIYGARFYGIGNELEALIGVMVPVGVGAGLSAYTCWGREVSRSAAVLAFASVSVVAALLFAVGRFGADVGAAIVLPVGAAVAVAALLGESVYASAAAGRKQRRGWTAGAVIGAPVLALSVVVLIDLISGANAHLTRSVLDAGGASDLADIAQRRLQLSADDFAQAAGNPLFWLVIGGACACLARWRQVDALLRPAPLARAGFLGACAAVAVGVLVNDSGATYLVLGSLALGATLVFAWAQTATDP